MAKHKSKKTKAPIVMAGRTKRCVHCFGSISHMEDIHKGYLHFREGRGLVIMSHSFIFSILLYRLLLNNY